MGINSCLSAMFTFYISATGRKEQRDILGMIFHITPLKHMLRPIIRTV